MEKRNIIIVEIYEIRNAKYEKWGFSFNKDGILNIKRSISQNFISKVTRKGKN